MNNQYINTYVYSLNMEKKLIGDLFQVTKELKEFSQLVKLEEEQVRSLVYLFRNLQIRPPTSKLNSKLFKIDSIN